jgi:hypothetical protein
MQQNRIYRMCGVVLVMAMAVWAKAPIQHMKSTTLGLEYALTIRGQEITKAVVPSYEQIHLMSIYYAPVQFVQLSLGLGGDRLEVDEYKERKFEGGYGFSPAAGVSLYSSLFARKVLRLTLSCNVLYLSSRDDSDYRYSGPIWNPAVGFLIHAGSFINMEVGGKGHIINGTMENTETGIERPFSNANTYRWYLAFTAISPNGVYLQINFDASSAAAYNGLQKGPEEATIGFTVGALITHEKRSKKSSDKESKYFPNYKDMKKRQKEMEKEIE